jgi:hypothetical protein
MRPQYAPLTFLAQSGARLGDGPIQLLHRALPRLGRQVRVPHGHFDGGVPHQLLNDLEGHAPHREVAAVGVAQVVPANAALRAADARHAQRPPERVLGHTSGEQPTIRPSLRAKCQTTHLASLLPAPHASGVRPLRSLDSIARMNAGSDRSPAQAVASLNPTQRQSPLALGLF